MIIEYIRSFALVFGFVLFAVLIARALQQPIEPMTSRPLVVKTIPITKDDIYDARMEQGAK
jgi:hypothetical protein